MTKDNKPAPPTAPLGGRVPTPAPAPYPGFGEFIGNEQRGGVPNITLTQPPPPAPPAPPKKGG